MILNSAGEAIAWFRKMYPTGDAEEGVLTRIFNDNNCLGREPWYFDACCSEEFYGEEPED